ncbi:unnamed protein product [Vicia faba]|uniref:Uncharacterized protein n=1 Tax=Vicia faba TaxID=3906 RepID=A0AAV1B181_VICFA|nr:unnamed protein product [Vicia faba]
MGWVWSDDDNDDDSQRSISSSGSDEHSSTTKIVKSQCRTEEVEPGKFVRKCEKTEELLRTCAGRPVEVLQSNREYTEEDITNEVLRGRSTTFGSSDSSSDQAEEMKNGLFDVIAKAESSSSSPTRRGIPIEEYGRQETRPRSMDMESGDTDFTGLAKDV